MATLLAVQFHYLKDVLPWPLCCHAVSVTSDEGWLFPSGLCSFTCAWE